MPNPVCPFAVQHILHGEEDRRQTIGPIGTALHTAVTTANGDSLGRYFDGETVVDESTFYVDHDGTIYQFGPVNRKANAQFGGNAFSVDGVTYGMVSVETWDGGHPSTPLTDQQCAATARLYAWLHTEWGISLDVSTRWNGPGAGWHSKYPEWNRDRHDCPGTVRVRQLLDVILPDARRRVAPTPQEDEPMRDERIINVPAADSAGRQIVLTDEKGAFLGLYSKTSSVQAIASRAGDVTPVVLQWFRGVNDLLALSLAADLQGGNYPGSKVRIVIEHR